MNKKIFKYDQPLELEAGGTLQELEIAYHTFGELNDKRDNVVWVCHALTANSDPITWWTGLVGPGHFIDPKDYYIVCANILGSCYGTTGPLSQDPSTGKPYYGDFPFITVRDQVQAHILLRKYLGIERIYLGLGGSGGGSQLLEWTVMEPDLFNHLALIATNAKESPWAIALHTAQRMAIEADQTWGQQSPEAGKKGLKAARAMGIPSYRNYHTFEKTQSEVEEDKLDHFKAASYQYYQGEKLANRFNAYSYYCLLKALDAHNLGRGRGSVEEVLKGIKTKTLLIGISSDILYPQPEQELIAHNLSSVTHHSIDSLYGHDGFLIETEAITKLLKPFLEADPRNEIDKKI